LISNQLIGLKLKQFIIPQFDSFHSSIVQDADPVSRRVSLRGEKMSADGKFFLSETLRTTQRKSARK